ncbi:hypothetical protein FANTH_4024 [Fusarium anthophilum]|uniref:Uncharacterized protein n=1 Tax=Fusarium anthophilum TaxID=48485 RepID=A0A8H5E8C3_9HYPO|nr:hypothetical protein FANTH_4024 [Fusarium anthophilum]
MCITNIRTYVDPNRCFERWSQCTLCANSRHGQVCARNVRIDHQIHYVPAPYDAPSSNPYTSHQRQPTPQHRPSVIDDVSIRPPEKRRIRFEEGNNHRRSLKHSCNSNSAGDGRNLDDTEYRAGRHGAKLRQEPDRCLRTPIAEGNANIVSRPIVRHGRFEVMNPHSQDYHADKFRHVAPEQRAQQERLRERMQPKRRLTVGGSSGRFGETGTYRYG